MRQVSKMDLVVVAVLGLVLFALAITLVDVGRRLADDEAHLLLKVRKASLPGSIADGAGALGLEVARGENTVNLVVDEHHRVTFAPDTAAAQAAAADGKAGASEGSRGGRP